MTIAAMLSAAASDLVFPPEPQPPNYVTDEAAMLQPGDVAAINRACEALMAEEYIPLIVVTIRSTDAYGAARSSVDDYARRTFNHYGIGRHNWNYGILLLIGEDNRRARIELGAQWGREADPTCQHIMDDLILARFKAGAFSEGIRLGVDGLVAMCRGEDLPEPPVVQRSFMNVLRGIPAWGFVVLVGGGVLFLRYLPQIVGFLTFGRVHVYLGDWVHEGPLLGGRRYGRWGGFGGGFGGGGGGFSGGGGASGGW